MIEKIFGGRRREHKEIAYEEVLPAACVEQRVLFASEEALEGILRRKKRYSELLCLLAKM